jgi:hypothetical protein
MVIIGGLVLRVKLVGIGDVPIGIESLWCLLVDHVVICAVPWGVHPLMWCLMALDSLLGVRVDSGFLFDLVEDASPSCE